MVRANSSRHRVRAPEWRAADYLLLLLLIAQGRGDVVQFTTVLADKRYRIAIATHALFTQIAAAVRALAAQPR